MDNLLLYRIINTRIVNITFFKELDMKKSVTEQLVKKMITVKNRYQTEITALMNRCAVIQLHPLYDSQNQKIKNKLEQHGWITIDYPIYAGYEGYGYTLVKCDTQLDEWDNQILKSIKKG